MTKGDANWEAKVLFPKVSPISHDLGNDKFLVPTVIAQLEDTSALLTTSYHYITDLEIDFSTASNDPVYFHNCKSTSFVSTFSPGLPDCNQSNGFIDLQVTGGSAPYKYLWNNGDTTATASNLTAGMYEVQIIDSKGCAETISLTLNDNTISLGIDPASISDVSCYGGADGSATAAVAGGVGTIAYSWSNSETTQTAVSLAPGPHMLEVVDANGCKAFTYVTIGEPDSITLTVESTPADCGGSHTGSVSASAIGGTPGYSFDWGNAGMGATVGNLPAGTYQVVLTDANSCTATAEVTIDEPNLISITLDAVPNTGTAGNPNGAVFGLAAGGYAPYTYDWTQVGSVDTTFGQSSIGGLCEGLYEIIVTDSTGCVAKDTVEVVGEGAGCATSINEALAAGINRFQLSPNPANDRVEVQVEFVQPEAMTLRLRNLHGQEISRVSFDAGLSVHHTIDLSSLSSGIYVIEIATDEARMMQRLIIQ